MTFLLDVYGAFAWDGTILLRGKEIHTATNESIKENFSKETANLILNGKKGEFKNEYEAMLFKVWTEELASITSFASIIEDFLCYDDEEDEDGIDLEKCSGCDEKNTDEYQDTDDDECFDEFEGLDEIDPNKDVDEDDWNLSI